MKVTGNHAQGNLLSRYDANQLNIECLEGGDGGANTLTVRSQVNET